MRRSDARMMSDSLYYDARIEGNIDHTGALLQTNGTVQLNAIGAVNNDRNTSGTAGQIIGSPVSDM